MTAYKQALSRAPEARSEDLPIYLVPPPQDTMTENAIIDKALSILELRMRRPGEPLHNPDTARRYCQLRIGHKAHEVFMVLYLDSHHRLIDAREEFRGTITQTAVYPREIVKSALELNASAVILVHNHPSGKLEPSHADQVLTSQIRRSLACVDVGLIDHIIVTATDSMTFASKGLL